MAAGQLKRSLAPNVQALPAAPEMEAALDRIPALVRARELFLSGMRQEAALEWQYGYQSLSEQQRKQSIRVLAGWGWYDQAVATATAERVFNDYDLLYPRPFDAEVMKAAETARLPPELVYGVIRQESLYRADAVSSAGARGLMQLQIDTARRTARASEAAEAGCRGSVRSRHQHVARRGLSAHAAGSLRRAAARCAGGLQRGPQRRRALASRRVHRCGRVDREHSLR